jgi:hypothetical protein
LALALAALGRGAGRIAVSAVVVLALATSIGVNYPLLNQRGYDLAEMYGRIHLEPAARHERAIVVLTRDDAIPVCVALQSVRGFHRHVAVVAGVALEERQSGLPSWYDRRLRKHFPWIRPGDYEDLRRVFGPAPGVGPSIAAFANANAGVPIYFDQPPPREMLRQDFDVVPAGVLWKLVPSTDLRIDRRDWDFPTTPEALVAQQRRARGFYMVGQPGGGFRLTAQAYEQTFFRELVQARAALGLWEASEGRSREAAALLRSVVSLDPRTYSTPVHLLALGKALIDLGSHAEAEPVLKGALRPEAPPGLRARVHLALARAAAGRGDAPGARVELERALSAAPELADQIRSEARAAGLLPD